MQHRHQLLGLLLGQQYLEIREVFPDTVQDVGQQVRTEGGENPQP